MSSQISSPYFANVPETGDFVPESGLVFPAFPIFQKIAFSRDFWNCVPLNDIHMKFQIPGDELI